VLSIGTFFTLIIAGLAGSLPARLLHGLTAHGVPGATAARVASLPPVPVLFASLLGSNPVRTLLGPVPGHLPPAQAAFLTSRGFFPTLISPAFAQGPVGRVRLRGWRLPDRRPGLATARREVRLRRIGRYHRPAWRGHRGRRGLACVPALAIAGFTRIVRWPLILPVPRLAAEFSRTEGITIKMVIRGTSAGFADAW